MNYSLYLQSYHAKQKDRVEAVRAKIAARAMVATEGRVVPSDGDLPIGVGRRLTAAVMFVDICGFSTRPSSTLAEQERILRALAFFFSELIRIIEDHGGTVEKNTGDGLMAYFPKDNAQNEHESQRDVAAALTMFYASKNLLNPVIERTGILPIEFRACIDHGPITVASVGAARRFSSFVAIGATANFACKLLNIAKKNQIAIGEHVLEGLPAEWRRRFCKLIDESTGWVHTERGDPYLAYEYTGRWSGVSDDS